VGTLEDTLKRLWRRASLSIRAPLGNLELHSSTRDFERWIKWARRSTAYISLSRGSGWRAFGEDCFNVDPERYVK
jgi:hypothetical protein